MYVPSEIESIRGATELHAWFGYWPSFHDAEVLSLHLNREGSSSLHIHTWQTTKELDDKGRYVMAKHIVVEFILERISGLNLTGFNHQNVIFALEIEKIDAGFRLTLEDCYGLAGQIEAEKISLRITPGMPS